MRKLLSGFSLDSDHHARRFAIAPATFLFIVLFPAVGLAAFPNGTPCDTNAQCTNGHCNGNTVCGLDTNGQACTANAQCESNTCGAGGTCTGIANGSACISSPQCANGDCVFGTCGYPNWWVCTAGTQCQANVCNATGGCGVLGGGACTAGTQCVSGTCTAGSCMKDANGTVCSAAGQCSSGICQGGFCGTSNGGACANGTTCASNNCSSVGLCAADIANGSTCTNGNSAECSGNDAICAYTTPTNRYSGCGGSQKCCLGQGLVGSCTVDSDCGCNDGSMFCDTVAMGGNNFCAVKWPAGNSCNFGGVGNGDVCVSGSCHAGSLVCDPETQPGTPCNQAGDCSAPNLACFLYQVGTNEYETCEAFSQGTCCGTRGNEACTVANELTDCCSGYCDPTTLKCM